jgi:hypothetical protein
MRCLRCLFCKEPTTPTDRQITNSPDVCAKCYIERRDAPPKEKKK